MRSAVLRSSPRAWAFAASVGVVGALASCGARTGLDSDVDPSVSFLDAAGLDGARDGALDSGSDADADAAPVACLPGEFPLTRAFPSVLFVVDRSSSMNLAFGSSTRWTTLKQALASALPSMDTSVALGALVFPAVPGVSCTAPTAPDLMPSVGNASAVVAKLEERGPTGSTPTALSLEAAASALAGIRTATSARAIVLATDGAPDCNSSLDPATCTCLSGTRCSQAERCLDDRRTVGVVSTWAARGIPTYVVGIQDSANASYAAVLDAMAVAGGKPRAGSLHKYYAATSAAELDSAFVAIRTQVGECTFLASSVPSTEGTIVVTLGGNVVPYDTTGQEGWRWTNKENGELTLTADLCAEASKGIPFTATVSCEPPDAGSDANESDAEGLDAELDGTPP